MARLAAPGGEGMLVAEVVSSDTLEGLAEMPEGDLAGLLRYLGRSGNHFRGVHPWQLLAAMRADPSVGPLAAAAPLAPWRWRLLGRTYLVGGMGFRLAPARRR